MKPTNNISTDIEAIKIRFKALKSGNKSIYLDCYSNGKRSYEFLKLYLVPETDAAAIKANALTMQQAESIRQSRLGNVVSVTPVAKVTKELVTPVTSPSDKVTKTKDMLLLSDILRIYEVATEMRKSKASVFIVRSMIDAVVSYSGSDILLSQVDIDYCKGFQKFLLTKCLSKRGSLITNTTAEAFQHSFSAALEMAVKINFLKCNPMRLIPPSEKIVRKIVKSVALDEDEVMTLISTPCPVSKRPQIRTSFLFSCYCGITMDNLRTLTWGNIHEADGETRIEIPDECLSIPLNEQALKWMPNRYRKCKDELVFDAIPTDARVYDVIQKWAKAAGITKKVTFKVARNTFIQNLINKENNEFKITAMLGYKTTKKAKRDIQAVEKPKQYGKSEKLALDIIDAAFE